VRIGAEIESVAASTKAAKVVNSEREEDNISCAAAPSCACMCGVMIVRTPSLGYRSFAVMTV
jgi:hypothetical protein